MGSRRRTAAVVKLPVVGSVELPPFALIEQRFSVPPPIDVDAALDSEWRRLGGTVALSSGADVAIAVGSRGIERIAEVVRGIVTRVRSAGCRPYVVPAMGSHGGATAKGQTDVLASLGISEDTVGAPVRATMETVMVGEADGIPLFVGRDALSADGLVLVNRIKPHTDFAGPMGSGLLKLLTIGLGKQRGADTCHRAAMTGDLGDVILRCGRRLLGALPVLFACALVENQEHRLCELRLASAAEIEDVDLTLQARARELLPGLPLDDIDLLIVDEMGKDISGAGLDPNVVGRTIGRWSTPRTRPRIARIFVRSLTPAAHGNASGLGFVDVATPRLIDAVDLEATAMNAVTACVPEDAKLPLTLPTEREAVAAALATIRSWTPEDLRVMCIANTSDVVRCLVSHGCLPALRQKGGVTTVQAGLRVGFDERGDLSYPARLGKATSPGRDGGAPVRHVPDRGAAVTSHSSKCPSASG